MKPTRKQTRALLAAIEGDDACEVVALLAGGADPCLVDTGTHAWGPNHLTGIAGLHLAFARDVGPVTRDAVLARPTLDVNVRSVDRRTPLHYLADYGKGAERLARAKQLIERGANVNAIDDRGETPLFETISFYKLDGELELIDILVRAGAKRGHKNKRKHTVLDEAFELSRALHQMNDPAGFARVVARLVAHKFPARLQPQIKQWLATDGAAALHRKRG